MQLQSEWLISHHLEKIVITRSDGGKLCHLAQSTKEEYEQKSSNVTRIAPKPLIHQGRLVQQPRQ